VRTLPWRRDQVIAEIRDRIWLHLSPASATEDLVLEAGALLELSDRDVLAIARALFLLSPETQAFLDDVPELLRRLPTSSAQVEERSTERVRGLVRWPATLVAQRHSGMPNLYVTAPAERAYDTPENELLAFLLSAITILGQETGWQRSTGAAAMLANARSDEAARLLNSRMLSSLSQRQPTPRQLARVRSGRHCRRFASAIALYDRYEELINHLDPPSLKDAIENGALVVQPDDKLFEIYVFLLTLDWFRGQGWTLPGMHLYSGGLKETASLGERRVDIHYQSVPSSLSTGSRYRAIGNAHGLRSSDLRPDLVLVEYGTPDRHLIVELKMGTTRSAVSSARAALLDLLSYDASFTDAVGEQEGPAGLGVVWGRGLKAVDGRHLLASSDHLGTGLECFLNWSKPG